MSLKFKWDEKDGWSLSGTVYVNEIVVAAIIKKKHNMIHSSKSTFGPKTSLEEVVWDIFQDFAEAELPENEDGEI